MVGAGRGAGSADGFGDLLELTELLDGALGVSRVVTSLGWRPHHEQVGQTGSRIAPDVYIACGISGAIQHWAGCSSAKTILAINTDADAPMVTKAHYAVIGDLHEIVPAINEELRRRMADSLLRWSRPQFDRRSNRSAGRRVGQGGAREPGVDLVLVVLDPLVGRVLGRPCRPAQCTSRRCSGPRWSS